MFKCEKCGRTFNEKPIEHGTFVGVLKGLAIGQSLCNGKVIQLKCEKTMELKKQ